MVELRQLRYFVAVAEELHFRRAAERLFISTPTLSQQIRAIEREVGGLLLVRGPQGVELTAAGEVLLASARDVLAAAEGAVRRTRAAVRADAAFRLGVVNGAPFGLSARMEALLRARKPGLRVALTTGTSAEQVRLVDQDEVDLAVLRGPASLPPHLTQAHVIEEELGVLVSAAHPLAAHDAIDPTALSGLELILFARASAPELHDDLLRQLRERGADVVLSDSALSHAQMLSLLPLRPDAIGLGSGRTAGTPGLAWRPLRSGPLRITYLAAWRTATRDPLVREIADILTTGSLPDRPH
ncbi:LysR substrate-binding domain-containing protein [Nocardia otitidiscaviarum]|uniref:LysR substrate-binding domain-containing protein n=1 Tax=Nocardia otitidiscaviarum TaxID=1823 RepID=UPI00245655F7|nr:LysR substrate-binding domain-containing protein [Nocardia otitidiscaviarum]